MYGGRNDEPPEVGFVVVPTDEVGDDNPVLAEPPLDTLGGAPGLTDGGGLASGSLIEVGGGLGGGGVVEGDASCHELLPVLARLFAALVFEVVLDGGTDELLKAGGAYEVAVVGGGGGSGTIVELPGPFMGKARV